jgi:hypothetical protein
MEQLLIDSQDDMHIEMSNHFAQEYSNDRDYNH